MTKPQKEEAACGASLEITFTTTHNELVVEVEAKPWDAFPPEQQKAAIEAFWAFIDVMRR